MQWFQDKGLGQYVGWTVVSQGRNHQQMFWDSTHQWDISDLVLDDGNTAKQWKLVELLTREGKSAFK